MQEINWFQQTLTWAKNKKWLRIHQTRSCKLPWTVVLPVAVSQWVLLFGSVWYFLERTFNLSPSRGKNCQPLHFVIISTNQVKKHEKWSPWNLYWIMRASQPHWDTVICFHLLRLCDATLAPRASWRGSQNSWIFHLEVMLEYVGFILAIPG
jgi:hypothetical protein